MAALLARLAGADEEVGADAVGDEGLGAVDDVAAVDLVLGEGGRHAGDVGAGARLGDPERADLLAGDPRHQPALLLLLGAEVEDRRHRDRGVGVEPGGDAAGAAASGPAPRPRPRRAGGCRPGRPAPRGTSARGSRARRSASRAHGGIRAPPPTRRRWARSLWRRSGGRFRAAPRAPRRRGEGGAGAAVLDDGHAASSLLAALPSRRASCSRAPRGRSRAGRPAGSSGRRGGRRAPRRSCRRGRRTTRCRGRAASRRSCGSRQVIVHSITTWSPSPSIAFSTYHWASMRRDRQVRRVCRSSRRPRADRAACSSGRRHR